MDVPLVKPHLLSQITFSFVHLEMASSSIYSVIFPGAEIRLAGHSSLVPHSWRWAWRLTLPVLRNHCQAPGPCKNGRVWHHNDITSSLSALQCSPSSPVDLGCVYPICCDMSSEVVPDPPFLYGGYSFTSADFTTRRRDLRGVAANLVSRDWGKSGVELLSLFCVLWH